MAYRPVSKSDRIVCHGWAKSTLLLVGTFAVSTLAANQSLANQPEQNQSDKIFQVQGGNWWENGKSKPVIHIIVDKATQRTSVYSNGDLVGQTNVSTGKVGHETPGGIFSILSKNRHHRSNIYSNAPMPFMQRLTWSGIALHESKSVPDYPASHGCIRMPRTFASQLFQFTRRGAQVLITRLNTSPQPFSSPNMFSLGTSNLQEASLLRPSSEVIASISTTKPQKTASKPLRVLLTRHTGRQRLLEIQSILQTLKYYKDDVDGWMGPNTGRAISKFQKDYGHRVTGALNSELLAQLYRATGQGKPKNGHIYVRQNKKPVLDMAVVLEQEDIPLGTHHFAAVHVNQNNTDATKRPFWLSTTIEPTEWPEKNEENINVASDAERAIERFQIPDELKSRISSLLTPGSTVIIADKGFSRETTSETDFIILTP